MTDNTFARARAAINAAIVEHFTHSPGAYWSGDEYWTLNPAREGDTEIGSFHISEDGRWYDHATGEGHDLIELVARMRGGDKRAAAEEIIAASGQVPPDAIESKPAKQRKEKPAPQIPIPEDARTGLRDLVTGEWYRAKFGSVSGAWRYHTAAAEWCFSIVRFDPTDGSRKQVLPFYYDGNRWRQGQPYTKNRPLYRLHDITRNRAATIVVVEGEKCADVPVDGSDYIVTTWAGGTGAVGKTDWSALTDRQVVVWPDADDPGRKAAREIQRRIPQALIVDTSEWSDGYDIADAAERGHDVLAVIKRTIGRAGEPGDDATESESQSDTYRANRPYEPLGYTENEHLYLDREDRRVIRVQFGSFRQSTLLEIAPLAWWGSQGLITDAGGVKVAPAQDVLVGESKEAGMHDPGRLRGAGVWRDAEGVVINDGARIITPAGRAVEYREYPSTFYYLKSRNRFGSMSGEQASLEESQAMAQIVLKQRWSNPAMGYCVLGWALIAPFAGVLEWRPHIWITGKRGSGKSYIFDNIIHPLCGPFAHTGSGKDSEAGIRRELRHDARPVLLDEMEPRTRGAQEKVESIIELARNASSDASGSITMADGSGTVRYIVRSCFAFASVQVAIKGAAISSRFTVCELQVADREFMAQSARLVQTMIRDATYAGRYRRRMFARLPQVLSDIRYLREQLAGMLGDQREADQFAPMLVAAWHAEHDETIQSPAGTRWIAARSGELRELNSDQQTDEQSVIEHILGAQVRTDENNSRSVAELLGKISAHGGSSDEDAESHLSRVGIRLVHNDGVPALAIATRSDRIREYLRGTTYEANYDAQLRRHPYCLTANGNTHIVATAIGRVRCHLLDWREFRATYLSDGNGLWEE